MGAVAIWLATVGYAVIYQGIRTVQHVPLPFNQIFSLGPAKAAAATTAAKVSGSTTSAEGPPAKLPAGSAKSAPTGPGSPPIVAPTP